MNLKLERGVTLAALGITVLILMLLTGLTVSFIGDDNGMVKQAEQEKKQTENLQSTTEKQINELYNQLQE